MRCLLANKNRKKNQIRKSKKLRKVHDNRMKKSGKVLTRPPRTPVDVPSIDMTNMLHAIANGDGQVWDALLNYLRFFNEHHYKAFGTTAIKKINEFVHCFFTAMAVEGFSPNLQQAAQLIQLGHVFQHLVATSSYRDNDALLDSVIPMQGNIPKMLMLLNPRGDIQPDQSKLFDAHPGLASMWYMTYMMGLSSPTKRIQKNLFCHLANMNERWTPPHHCLSGLYFVCTYHNPEAALRVKSIINKGIKAKGGLPEFTNTPQEGGQKHVAIVTSRWHRNHAVYKSASPLVEQLVGKCKLTLIWTSPPDRVPDTMVTDYFDEVVYCYFKPDGTLEIPAGVVRNDFDMVYYPDIGMSDESIWMSNMRIAPIQAVGYGHPDTTGANNEIDYFIGGDVEKESTDSYAETMVLLPGLAQEPAWPTAERKHNYKNDGVVRVNCVWGPDKYNHTLLTMLAEINKRVAQVDPESKHEIHLFGSPGMNRYAALPPFLREIRKMLPNAVVHSEQEYYAYMENAEMHDFSLNSFPFGCYNVLIESLYMGLPFLTLVGDRFYNRAGMYLNDQIGMGENNFTDPQGLIAKAVELITNPDELKRQRARLASLDLKEKLFTLKGQYFLEAVEYIFANHPFTDTKIIGDDA